MARRQGKQDASTSARSQGGKTPANEAAVYLALSGGVIDSEPVGEDQPSVEGLQAGVDIVIGHHAFPQDQLKVVLGRAPRPPVLLARRKRSRRGFCYPDIDHVLRELVKLDGRIPADGLVWGTAWLLPGPKPREDATRWLNRVLQEFKLSPVPDRGRRERQGKSSQQDLGAGTLPQSDLTPEEALEYLQQLNDEITHAHQAFAERLDRIMLGVAGKSFGEEERNKKLAEGAQETAGRVERRLRCPTCQSPGTLSYAQGKFKIGHRVTSHGFGDGFPAASTTPDRGSPARSLDPPDE